MTYSVGLNSLCREPDPVFMDVHLANHPEVPLHLSAKIERIRRGVRRTDPGDLIRKRTFELKVKER